MYKYKWCEFILASSLGLDLYPSYEFCYPSWRTNFGAWNEFWCLDYFLLSWSFLIGKFLMVGYTLNKCRYNLMLFSFLFLSHTLLLGFRYIRANLLHLFMWSCGIFFLDSECFMYGPFIMNECSYWSFITKMHLDKPSILKKDV